MGIAIAAPTAKLHVVGDSKFTNTSIALTGTADDFLASGDNAANTGNLIKATVSGTSAATVPIMATNAGTGLSLRVNDDGTDTDSTPFAITATGNVGIGDDSPTAKLHVVGDSKFTNTSIALTGTANDFLASGDNAANTGNLIKATVSGTSAATVPIMATNAGTGLSLRINDDGTDTDSTPFAITATGDVGIGITSPTRKLDVTGTVGLSSSITDATGTPGSICYDTSTFEMTKNNALTCTVSDARAKKDIYSLSGLQISALNLIDKMKPSEFSMLKEPDNRRRWGFIAQDLREADKRLADGYGPNYSDDGSLTIDQTAILAVAVKAIQE
ncbi:MAG: tail fiber domain-containing protein, partial [Methylococcales bacterium]